jgi:CelD/BcsL family acetyltransferase involved in cellulose biosynthesis
MPREQPASSGAPAPVASQPATGAGRRYSIHPVTSEEDLAGLQDDWRRLSESAALPNVFTTYDWFRAWNRRRAREDMTGRRRVEVLALRDDGVVSGLVPMIRRETARFGVVVRKLEFLSSPADYNDLVVGGDSAGRIEAVVDHLAQTRDQWDVVDLRSLRETGNARAAIQSALSRAGLVHQTTPGDRSPFVPIDANWSEMVQRRSASSRGMLRTKQHRLDRMRDRGLRLRIVENVQNEPGLLDKLVALEAQKHIGGEPMPPFLSRYREVFQDLFGTLGPRGWMYVALMEFGERPIAWQLGFRCGRKLWYYQTAYDHEFARLSPGTMLIPAVLDYGFGHGYDELDFLTGEERYKMNWSIAWHETFRLRIWSRRAFSWAHRAWGSAYRVFATQD